MQVRIALIALASALHVSAFAGPYMAPLGKVDRHAAQTRAASPVAPAANARADAAGWLYVGGQEGYRFVGTGRSLTRAEFLQQQADSAAAGTRDGWIAVGGQEGARFLPHATSVARAQVQHDAMHARHVPAAVDGWLAVGGEVGAVYVGAGTSTGKLQAFAPMSQFGMENMLMPDGSRCTMVAARTSAAQTSGGDATRC